MSPAGASAPFDGLVSVIVPVHDEAGNVAKLVGRLETVLAGCCAKREIVLVDDGSTDGSTDILRDLARRLPSVRCVILRGNFGKSAALAAGFRESRGEVVVTMDADLQDDPREIPRFLAMIGEGYDLVSGWKHVRNDPISKRVPSRVFNLVTRTLLGTKLHDMNCGFKCYRREVIDTIDVYGELHRYIPAFAHAHRFRIGELRVRHHARTWGRSKYGGERYLRGLFDLLTVLILTRFSFSPLYFFGVVGLAGFVPGFLILLYLTVLWFLGEPIGHRPLLSLGILLCLTGVQVVSVGLIAEMISNLRLRPSARNPVREVVGGEAGADS